MKKILVIGASGFIGEILFNRLRQKDLTVRTLVKDDCEEGDHPARFDLVRDEPSAQLFLEVDTVFHLAGKAHALAETHQEEAEYFQINTEGTHKLLEAAKQAGVQTFIYFSSVKAVGDSDTQPMDESVQTPAETPYGQSKYAAEQLVLHGGYVPHPVVIRPSMVYGNTEKGNLPRMIDAIRKGYFPPLPEVHNKRSMVHVEDVVQAALLAAENPKAAGQIYIVSDGRPYSTREIYDWICEALGKSPSSFNLPLGLLNAMAKVGDGIGRLRGRRFFFDSDALDKLNGSAWYSSSKIERELGFTPVHDLKGSLPEIVRYLERNG
ncbi:MAG: NAD-dependent epimerase/dehydratase family protein [Methylomicrobium sp.]|nr:NAD-dependent epimerase/dehydratase family protein [Methylomicrobium sp.]